MLINLGMQDDEILTRGADFGDWEQQHGGALQAWMPAHLDCSPPECMTVCDLHVEINSFIIRDSGDVGEETSKIKWPWLIYVEEDYHGIEAGDSDLRAQAAR